MSGEGAAPARRIVNPWSWQDAFGFVQAHEVGGPVRTIYCAGQGAIDDAGAPIHEGDMAAQVERAFENLETVLGAAGAGLADVVRLVYYTTDVAALFEAWGVVAGRLAAGNCRPASSLLGVQALAMPQMLIEIEATAVVADGDG